MKSLTSVFVGVLLTAAASDVALGQLGPPPMPPGPPPMMPGPPMGGPPMGGPPLPPMGGLPGGPPIGGPHGPPTGGNVAAGRGGYYGGGGAYGRGYYGGDRGAYYWGSYAAGVATGAAAASGSNSSRTYDYPPYYQTYTCWDPYQHTYYYSNNPCPYTR